MPNGKTIRQIKLYTFIVDSVKYYTPDGEALIKSLFSGKSTVKQTVNECVKLSTESVYTPVNEFTPCKDGEIPIKSGVSDGAVNEGVNKAVNVSTNSVYTHVNEFTANLTDLFTAQLKEKDKQLAEKDAQIAALTAMLQSAQEQQAALVQTLAAEQALAAADKQRLLLQAKSTTEHQEATEKSEQSKKGFFHKIFGK